MQWFVKQTILIYGFTFHSVMGLIRIHNNFLCEPQIYVLSQGVHNVNLKKKTRF